MPTGDPPAGAQLRYGQQFRRCGKVGCGHCRPGMQGHGPYWFAYWREGGRQRSRYLGKAAPPAATLAANTVTLGIEIPVADPLPERLLRVRTLGAFAVWRGDEALPAECWHRPKVAALFKCLLGADGCRMAREQLIDLLWPEVDPTAGGRNLRATLHLLRKALDRPGALSYIRLEGPMLVVAPAGASQSPPEWLDAHAFVGAARRVLLDRDAPACAAALALYGGEYLPDDSYADWAVSRREELRQLHLALLLHWADLCLEEDDTAAAVRSLRLVLATEPCHEGAACTLMRLQALGGQRLEALHTYRALEAALRRDLDLAPEVATGEIYRAITEGRIQAPASAPAMPWDDPAGASPDSLPASAAPDTPRADAELPTNLPAPVTSFVGRALELRTLGTLLARRSPDGRLLTLIGAGGCGKTRLALEAAAAQRAWYADGVWLVELASLPRSPTAASSATTGTLPIAAEIAAVLGVRERPETPLLRSVTDYLHERALLLVLDNCEHVVASCAMLVATLLSACPRLRILATSREVLGVAGETAYPVSGLSLPVPLRPNQATTPESPPSAEYATQFEAVQLFVERVRLTQSGFALTPANAGAVVQICCRLDGIPLALELAAARVGLLGLDGLLARLDDRFRLLTKGNRAAPPRHRTLQAVLDWSYNLLDVDERTLLRRLSVFTGGWQLDAAEAVCGDVDDPPVAQPVSGLAASQLLDLLSDLVDKSLVVVDAASTPEGAVRYTLLETVRQYGWMRLVGSGEEAAMRSRHCAWCVSLVEAAEPELRGPHGAAWLDRLDMEHDNLRAAARWCMGGQEGIATGLRLAAALWQFWERRGYMTEGQRWLAAVLARAEALIPNGAYPVEQGVCVGIMTDPPTIPIVADAPEGAGAAEARRSLHTAWARALNGAGMLAHCQGDLERATALHSACLALRRTLGDTLAIAASLHNLANVCIKRGELADALVALQQGLVLHRECSDRWGTATALASLGCVAHESGDYAQATAYFEEALLLLRELGDRWAMAVMLSNISSARTWLGDHEGALHVAEESLALRRELGDPFGIGMSLGNLGSIAVRRGQRLLGIRQLREALTVFRQIDARSEVPWSIERLAAALSPDQPLRAAQLLAAVSALRESISMPVPPGEVAEHDANLAALRGALGDAAFAVAWDAGNRLSFERTLALALEDEGGLLQHTAFGAPVQGPCWDGTCT